MNDTEFDDWRDAIDHDPDWRHRQELALQAAFVRTLAGQTLTYSPLMDDWSRRQAFLLIQPL